MNDSDTTTRDAVLALGSHEELAQRLNLVPSRDMARGFVFITTLNAVRSEAGEAVLKRCATAAEGGSFIPFFNYPIRSLLRLFYTAAWELSGKYGGFERAMWHLGARSAPDFMKSAVGKMLMALSGTNVKQLISGIPVAYPTVYDHGSCTLVWTGTTSGQLHLHGNLLPPPFIEGAVVHVLQAVHPQGLFVQVRRVAPTKNVLTVSWEATQGEDEPSSP
ncbi:TIGR02265 family protein [Vitiosangium sp. GDMCC 1.1324]|uniref:TIGR02265 family protein n=1 Tax=Vitiosangium sp. (strain GDMCC 1.1324) TaxID=2138576 RepID=UPI000D35E69A|nr:TIGR02265 family protein [Vitiosangium sp. GDMCC 1.1324]PTL83170.1 TIGR02265 family protein [Vitiosangium sp. GDMCC 1.1324]